MKYVLMIAICIGAVWFMSDTADASTRGVVTGNNVNVRSYADVNSNNRVTQVSRGQAVEVLDVDGDFFRVHVGDLKYVYISRDFINITETVGTINYDWIYFYDLPRDEGGQRIGQFISGQTITLTSAFYNWLGFTFMDEPAFIEATHVAKPAFVQLPSARISFTLADEVVEFAKRYFGYRYVFGGTTPSGFDCSGFMVYIMGHFGISLYRRSTDMARNGVQVNRSDIMPGDLLFFATMGGGRVSHVGMYIGGGRMIHAANSRCGVRFSDIHSDYFRTRFVTARRVI